MTKSGFEGRRVTKHLFDDSVPGELQGSLLFLLPLLGGGLVLSGKGRVDGSALALGARVETVSSSSTAASIGGRLLNVAALEAAFLTELRTSPLRAEAVSSDGRPA